MHDVIGVIRNLLWLLGHACHPAVITGQLKVLLPWLQGPILAFIYAVKEMLEEGQGTDASLPVNVAFVFEGEEENGKQALQPHSGHTLLTFIVGNSSMSYTASMDSWWSMMHGACAFSHAKAGIVCCG